MWEIVDAIIKKISITGNPKNSRPYISAHIIPLILVSRQLIRLWLGRAMTHVCWCSHFHYFYIKLKNLCTFLLVLGGFIFFFVHVYLHACPMCTCVGCHGYSFHNLLVSLYSIIIPFLYFLYLSAPYSDLDANNLYPAMLAIFYLVMLVCFSKIIHSVPIMHDSKDTLH